MSAQRPSKRESNAARTKRLREERASRVAQLKFCPASRGETVFRHSGWEGRRAKVTRALERSGASDLALHNWHHCGSHAVVEWSEKSQRYRIRANYCRSRHCEPCMRTKANKIARNLEDRLSAGRDQEYRFVTLTLAHTPAPLADQIRRLFASFKKLRQRGIWKSTQRGGAFMLEVKLSQDGWHPHLHIVTSGSFLNQRALSEAWRDVTGDSFIVDVRAVKSSHDAAYYVAKYITKGTTAAVWDDEDAAQEWITASKGVRTCSTFGTWRGESLLKVKETADDWRPLVTLNRLLDDVRDRRRGSELLLDELLKMRAEQRTPRPPPSRRAHTDNGQK